MRGAQQHIVVAGAGAVGSAIALGLVRAGHRVTVVDPAPPGANASGVAAGMLAPAFETVFDETPHDGFEMFAAARDLWPALEAPLARDGALALGGRDEVEAWAARLQRAGARHRLLRPSETAALTPGLGDGRWAVFSDEDWRLDPPSALAALREAAAGLGARFLAAEVVGLANGRAELRGLPSLDADLLVLATGAARAQASIAPELALIEPVKGHILRAVTPWPIRPVIRAPGLYLCPTPDGLALGATMEPGLADAAVDAEVARALADRGAAAFPGLGRLRWRAAAGVRGATADGLPLVGASRTPGVVLAVGARRNGWLLAPLIAAAVVRLIDGAAPAWPDRLFAPERTSAAPSSV